MALQAIGVDGLTTIWLWAEGTGTELDPYKSNFYAYQGGNWNVSVDNFPATQIISGTVDTGLSQPLTNDQLRVAPIDVTGTFWQDTQPVSISTLPPLASGSNTIGAISNVSFEVSNFPVSFAATQSGTWSVGVTNFPATQAVSATSLPLPLGAATSANQATIIGHIDGIESALSGTLTVNTGLVQPLTDTQLRASPVPVSNSLPRVTSGTILSLTTNTTGTTYTAFSSQSCTALDIVNNTGVTIEYRRNGTGTAMQIPDKSARLVLGITNANQIDIRRTDTSNTQVTLQAEAFVL